MKRLRVGLIGCGHISATHLKSWARTRGSRVQGVFDLDADQARAQARRFGVPKVYPDIDSLLSGCDVVDVCTPPQTHEELIHRVLDAGRHLVIEKPIVTELRAWERIRERYRQADTQLCVIHNVKFAHSVQTARRWLTEGRLGELLSVDWNFLTTRKSPTQERFLHG